MTEILDEIEVKAKKQKIFSILSLVTSLITLGWFSMFILLFMATFRIDDGVPQSILMMIVPAAFFSLTGMFMVVLSFSKKEPSTWFKWVGVVLNGLLFLLIFGLLALARLLL